MRLTGRNPVFAIALAACWLSLPAEAVDSAVTPSDRVAALWYADGSCRLRIDEREHIGVTAIDADMGEDGARTMVHCDAEDGQRITLMMRGDGLALGERVVLAEPAEIDNDADSSAAWVSRPQPDVPSADLARRYVIDGRILIHASPTVDATDSTLNADKLPFAEIHGRLEPLKRHPGSAPATPLPSATGHADPPADADATRLACRGRPCGR